MGVNSPHEIVVLGGAGEHWSVVDYDNNGQVLHEKPICECAGRGKTCGALCSIQNMKLQLGPDDHSFIVHDITRMVVYQRRRLTYLYNEHFSIILRSGRVVVV